MKEIERDMDRERKINRERGRGRANDRGREGGKGRGERQRKREKGETDGERERDRQTDRDRDRQSERERHMYSESDKLYSVLHRMRSSDCVTWRTRTEFSWRRCPTSSGHHPWLTPSGTHVLTSSGGRSSGCYCRDSVCPAVAVATFVFVMMKASPNPTASLGSNT